MPLRRQTAERPAPETATPTAASGHVSSSAQALIQGFGQKGSCDIGGPETVEVVMGGIGKPYHLLRLVSKPIKFLAEPDRDGGIAPPMHDQHGGGHIGDP